MSAVMKDPPNPDLRQQVHALAERLSDTATWRDVVEYARLRAAVAGGHEAIERGELADEG